MTSLAAPVHLPFSQQQQTTETFETTSTSTYYENIQDATIHPYDEDTEMTDTDKLPLVENGYDDQDTYNADNESTVVEPPQSDAVMTHAPSTILDEMEFLDEVDYEEEEQDPSSKVPDIHLVHGTETYKVHSNSSQVKADLFQAETTLAHTPPATSLEDNINQPQHIHSAIFSPSSRMIPLARSSTPHLAAATITTSGEDETLDDDWPIFLCTPTGQEYMLFRSDGDTEALFEDNWLKSQPLETFFSSIRQTLESELVSLTTSFAMDEIVLAIPDLDVSIAEVISPKSHPCFRGRGLTVSEDNCYTREISLQDLVNLINDLCVKNGTERAETCKLHLSLQPRFIARFNQLVSITSQTWDPSKQNIVDTAGDEEGQQAEVEVEGDGGEGGMIDEDLHPDDNDAEYIDYDGEDNGAEVPEYENEDHGDDHVKFQEPVEGDDAVEETEQDDLTAAEEDELYEENDEETFAETVESREALVNEDDDVVEVLEEPDYAPQQGDHEEEYEDVQAEEQPDQLDGPDVQEESTSVAVPHGILSDIYSWLSGSDTDDTTGNDDDDLISYEEAVDQTEDGQDYRQQYLAEQDPSVPTAPVSAKEQLNGLTPHHDTDVPQTLPLDTDHIATMTMDAELPAVAEDIPPVSVDSTSDSDALAAKRSLDEVIDPSVQDQAPRKFARRALSDDIASKRAKS